MSSYRSFVVIGLLVLAAAGLWALRFWQTDQASKPRVSPTERGTASVREKPPKQEPTPQRPTTDDDEDDVENVIETSDAPGP